MNELPCDASSTAELSIWHLFGLDSISMTAARLGGELCTRADSSAESSISDVLIASAGLICTSYVLKIRFSLI